VILVLEIALGVALGLLLFKHWQSVLGLLFVGGLAATSLYVLWRYETARSFLIFIVALVLRAIRARRVRPRGKNELIYVPSRTCLRTFCATGLPARTRGLRS
jgi:hypothetical protein